MDKFFEIMGFLVASFGGAGAIIVGLSSWIGKIWANKFYEKEKIKQEEYLTEIQNKFDIKLAEINAQLEKNKLQFELLNKERVEVIKNLYVKLVDMEDFLGIYFRKLNAYNIDVKKKSVEYLNVEKAVSDFMEYNNHNRIFFNETICHDIKEIDAIITIILDMHSRLSDKPDEGQDITKKVLELLNKMIRDEIPKFKRNLENEFRLIIGVIN